MASDPRPIIVLAGPTASGKTSAAIALAELLPIEIISADARQIYRGLDIGTATPSIEERGSVPHHLIDALGLHEEYSASHFANDAQALFESIDERKIPVLVGGSGLYIKAAIDGLSEASQEPNPEIRTQLRKELEDRGREAMYDELVRLDAKAAERYADKNPRRVLRALEYIRQTGSPFSSLWEATHRSANVDATYFAIEWDRQILYDRINTRCDHMWSNGIFEETKRALDAQVDRYAQSLRTVGYKEVCEVLLDGRDSDEALEAFKMSSRRYAKRQMTWFRADERYQWLDGDQGADTIASKIFDHIRTLRSFARFVD